MGAEPKQPILSRSRLRSSGVQELIALVIMLALIVLVMSRGTPLFLTPRNITNLLLDTTTVSIIAVFTTMLMISRGLDLSVASTAALCGVIIGSMQQTPGLWMGVLAALGVGTAAVATHRNRASATMSPCAGRRFSSTSTV